MIELRVNSRLSIGADIIDLNIKGYIKSNGDFEFKYYLPNIFTNYIKGKEKVIHVNNTNIVNTELNYEIVKSNDFGLLNSFKTVAYNNFCNMIENKIIDYYKNNRKKAFNNKNAV